MFKALLGSTALLALAACGGSGSSSGYIAENDHVTAVKAAGELTIGDVLVGGNQNVPQTAVFKKLPISKRCRSIRPRGNALVVNVSAYEGEAVSRDRLWWKAPDHEAYAQIEQSEIIITETERPVFLILGSYESILWKVHAAPGAQVDGVVAVAMHVPLITGDVVPDRVGFISRKLEGQKECAVYPSNSSADKRKAWDRFMKSYLRKPDQMMYSYRVNAALIGPVPAAPVPATALFDTAVYMPEFDGVPTVATYKYVAKIRKAQLEKTRKAYGVGG